MEAIFTPATLAKRWDCSERHVRNLISAGKLACFRLGGKLVRIKVSEVEKFECQNGESPDCGESSPSPSTVTDDVSVIHSAPMIRARLTSLRRPSSQS
jgi:excisionase family DNA binding protein